MEKHEARTKALQKKLEVTEKVRVHPSSKAIRKMASMGEKKEAGWISKGWPENRWKRKGRHPQDMRSTERIPSGLSGYDQ